MKCKKCGQEIDNSGKFCPQCGTPVDGEQPASNAKKAQKPFYKRWWFWLIAVVILFGGCTKLVSTPAETTPATETAAVETTTELTVATVAEETVANTQAVETQAVTDTASVGEKNALRKAHDYLNYTAFSYTGLIEQLEYEGFTTEEATRAADNCGADWNEQAVKKAKEYLDYSSFSRSGLIGQLKYEGFTNEQAEYGVTQNGL